MLYQLARFAMAAASVVVAVSGQGHHNRTLQSYSFDELAATENVAAAPADHVQHSIRSGKVAAKGVNLGSWLVTEQWMTAQAPFWKNLDNQYANKGEYIALAKGADHAKRVAEFENHHATFVMEKDIQDIANAGLNTVRVPVGYWITGDDQFDPSGKGAWKVFPKDTLKRVDTLIRDWALKHNVAVLISIHAAKGSQSGADHSSPTDPGKAYWSKYPENVDNTIHVAKFLGDRYKNDAAFLGIGLLNEPTGDTDEKVLNDYYQRAYKAVRGSGNNCVLTIMPLLHKQTADNLVGFMEKPSYTNVWVEWHPYFIWGYEKWSAGDLLNNGIKRDFINKINKWNSRPNANRMFFGEWSLASAGQYTNSDTEDFLKWTKAQMEGMNKATGGWTYWSWRMYGDENGFNGWSMRSVLRKSKLKSALLG
ncbi:hypothetical protein Poli38472_004629 [Pythium oligandrum]|uniref:glucan 1,3-beta-glucosidase n=1 Tax=Pythium oligandrum TaxID=41045 RepID=A0A8K1CAL2_PYTOL|nr:hypothetical protein Poli38472_004629 [Pythium oligandrum]|eukprot:TMW59560.1 hypothetical protein Poli38472_004629 [Pythium oligandrum]